MGVLLQSGIWPQSPYVLDNNYIQLKKESFHAYIPVIIPPFFFLRNEVKGGETSMLKKKKKELG